MCVCVCISERVRGGRAEQSKRDNERVSEREDEAGTRREGEREGKTRTSVRENE